MAFRPAGSDPIRDYSLYITAAFVLRGGREYTMPEFKAHVRRAASSFKNITDDEIEMALLKVLGKHTHAY